MDALTAPSPRRSGTLSRTLLAALRLALLLVSCASAAPAQAGQIAIDSSWTAPQEPFRIHGNTWYVGPQGLGVFLITSAKGHVLIDGGLPGGAALILANVRALGFEPRDIHWILNTHAHFDHAGDIAQLARDTGAEVIVGSADSLLLARGGRDDPQYGDRFPFPPVKVSRTVRDGERLQLGDVVVTAHSTPGHTQGNTTWSWESCEGERCLRIVDVGSLSAPTYKLVGRPDSEQLVEDYERSFAKVASLPCDIALAPHPGMVEFWERVERRRRGDAAALIDTTLCRAYADSAREGFERELAKQRSAARAKPGQPGGRGVR